MIKWLLTITLFLITLQAWAATYYVRDDGGDSTRCTGLADAADPGSGSAQACAYAHPAWALGGPSTSGTLSAGDTLIIDNDSHVSPGTQAMYKIGYGMPNATCSTSFPWDCMLDQVPNGVDVNNKTKIYGKGYASCDTKPVNQMAQLWGNERAYVVLNIGSNVDIQCLEITDHSGCIESGPSDGTLPGGDPVKCERSTYPYGQWAATGIQAAADSSGISTRNVFVHGMAGKAFFAQRAGNIDMVNAILNTGGFVGWDSDGSGDDGYTGTVTFSDSLGYPSGRASISWNGCGEVYPLTTTNLLSSTDKHHCWSQTQGGFGDGIGLGDGTAGNWTFTGAVVSWNTSDGVDLLHGNGTGTVKFIRSRAEGNAGNQFKTSVANSYIENSIIIGNCGFHYGQSFTSTKDSSGSSVSFDWCRANGDTISFSNSTGGQKLYISNSTVLSNGNVIVLSGGTGCDGSTQILAYNNIFRGGREFGDDTSINGVGGNDTSDFYYASGSDGNGAGACGSLAITNDYNIIYGTKNIASDTDCTLPTHNQCNVDPLFTGTIKQGPYTSPGYYITPDYSSQLSISVSSPAIGSGTADETITITGTSNDYNAYSRGAVWDVGAYEYGSAVSSIKIKASGIFNLKGLMRQQ